VNLHLSLFDDIKTLIPIVDFNIKYDSLIEFIDDDSNGFFDPITDTIIGKTILDNMLRMKFDFGIDGEPAYHSSYSTIDRGFKVDFYTTGEHVLLSRGVGLLTPHELKSVITINNYSSITGGTNLALNLSISSSHDLSFSAKSLYTTTSTGDYEVRYEWYNLAIINGFETPINTTTPSSPIPLNKSSIYLNFGDVINATYNPILNWRVPNLPNSFSITDIPWAYITIGSISIIAIGTAAKIPRSKKKKQKPEPKPPSSKFDSIATSVEPTPYSSNKNPKNVKDSQNLSRRESTDHVSRKKPGRVKYSEISSQQGSSHKNGKAEKRIPDTLRHRDRLVTTETKNKSKKSQKDDGETIDGDWWAEKV
jgi:hypothetical protein